MRIFVPIWSPPEGVHAGGFYRAKRMLESFDTAEAYVAKNHIFDVSSSHCRTYRAALYSPYPVLFQLSRLLNWICSAVAIAYLGISWRATFDAVYVPTSEILPTTAAGWLVARLRRIPLILCNLNVRDTELWLVNRWFHRRADAIITLSDALAEELREEGITVPIALGTVGVDDRHVERAPSPQYDAVYVGRHTTAKGAFDLLEIWSLVCAELPGAKLVTAGSINSKISAQWQREIVARGLERHVTYRGSISEGDKWNLFSNARLCLFPSHVEGWGIVPIEAHLAGLPVVAYDLPAFRATLRMSPSARLVRLGDRRKFAAAIIALLQSNMQARNAQEWASQYSWQRAAQREEALLDLAVSKARDKQDHQTHGNR